MAEQERFQVVIVGGGPVGLALAVALGQRGVSCALVERRLTPQRIPKGQNLTHRSLEHFYFWRLVDELRAARVLPPGYPIGGVTAYGDLRSPYWFAPVGREALRPFFFQNNDRLPQYRTEAVLRERIRALANVRALFGWSAAHIEERDDGVRIAVFQEHGRGERVLEAEFLVGCDGSRSGVREHIAVDQGGADFDERMVLAVFRSRELHRGLAHLPERTTYRVLRPELKGYWQFFGRVDVGEGWFFHAPVPKDATTSNFDVHALIQQAAGFSFPATFDHLGFWDLRIAVATAYSRGRIFIAGDAAHSHPPYGSFGLNSGLEDVVNLAWKLTGVLEGWAGARLLQSYGEERRPVFVETGEAIAGGIAADRAFLEQYSPEQDEMRFAEAWRQLGRVAGERQRAYEPHYEGSPVVAGPPDAVCGIRGQHSLRARAGHHLAPVSLSSGRNVFEELGAGFSLLALDVDDAAAMAFQRAASSLGVPLRVLRDTYTAGRTCLGRHLVLIRPDQYVAWAGDLAPVDPTALIRKVTGT